MIENPYQSPQSVDDVPEGPRAEETLSPLQLIAHRHRVMLVSVAIYGASVAGMCVLTAVDVPFGHLLVFVAFGATFFMASAVARLDMALDDSALAVIHWLLAIFPCFNLPVLFAVDRKAKKVLRRAGFHVGLMGADMMQFGPRESSEA